MTRHTESIRNTLVACLRAGLSPFTPVSVPPTLVTDWAAVIDLAHRESVSALLYAALKQSGQLAQVPPALAQRLHLTYIQAHLMHERTVALVGNLLAQFAAEHIPVVLLKGAALAMSLYPDPAWRRLGDLDVLIHPVDKERVATLLRANEFTPLLDLNDGFREQLGSEQTYIRRGKQGMTIDVHWQVINVPSYAQVQNVAWFWAHTQRIPYGNQTAEIFDATAQFLHLAEHFVLHHQMQGVRWSCDLAWLLARDEASLDWTALDQAAQRFGVKHALEAVCAHVETEWGVALSEKIRQQWTVSTTSQIKIAVETTEHSDLLFLREAMSYQGWRRKLIYVSNYFFPSPTYMQTRYCIKHKWLLPLYYAWRLGLGMRRLLESSISVLRNALHLAR